MSKQTKPLPKFKNEAEERAFWETKGKDSTEFLDWKEAQAWRVSGILCKRVLNAATYVMPHY